MVFSSAIFLFVFLPIVFGLSLLPVSLKLKNGLLIFASLFFYAFGEPVYVFLMIVSTLINYLFGRLLGKMDKEYPDNKAGVFKETSYRDNGREHPTKRDRQRSRLILWIAVIINIAMLGVFKYAGFAVETWNLVFHTTYRVPEIALPIGISFFTFQAMSYVIDVYRDRTVMQKSFWKLLLYISFFPQLIAGPIIRYHDVERQLNSRTMKPEQIVSGIQRFIKGLFKKLWVANTMGSIADSVYALDILSYNAPVAWLGAVCYTLQIYYDFSGYSDMAIGLAAMFGFTFKENFEHPYSSMDIREFWRRWHISLSGWFREYVYIPLGGNRKGRGRTEFNKMIVFLLTGIWHGASWTFVLWGVFHGIMIVLEDTILPIRRLNIKIIRNLYTWLIVTVAFVFFRADSIIYAGQMILEMFTGFSKNAASVSFLSEQMSAYHIFVGILAILFSYPIAGRIGEKMSNNGRLQEGLTAVCSIGMLLLSMLNLASASYNPFIYFRF